MTETERHIEEHQRYIPIPKVIINCLYANIIIGLLLIFYLDVIASPDKLLNGGGKFGPVAFIAFASFIIGRLILSWDQFVSRNRRQTINSKLATDIGIITLARYISIMSSIMSAAVAILTIKSTI